MNTGEECAGMARRRRSPRLHPQIQVRDEGAGGTTRRRSPRLHPQIQASEEGAGGTTGRRSPRLHPQIQASEEGAGGTTRGHSPRLHPPIQASEIGAGMTHRRIRRRRGISPAGPSCMTDDDDILREILIRLPPEPSSLPRASAVCRRWRSIVTDPKFHRQFYAHHRKPPLLGVFSRTFDQGIVFNPVLDPPDRIPLPPLRFSLACHRSNHVLDCRHGLVLVGDIYWTKKVVVCDPITGEQRRVPSPPEFSNFYMRGAVLCAAGNQGHVHGGCHSSPFKVVLISSTLNPLARVYSSETGGWGNLISTAAPYQPRGCVSTSTLVGTTLYWSSSGGQILELDLDGQGLSVIMGPLVTNALRHRSCQIVQAEDGAVGYAILSYPHFHMWVRNVNGHGLATWEPWKTIEMDSILGLPPRVEGLMRGQETIQGYEEDTDVIFLKVNGSVYMVELKSMQSQKLDETFPGCCHPFRSFYTPAIRECDKADMLPGT